MDSVVLDSVQITLRGGVEDRKITDFVTSNASSIGDVLAQQSLVFVKPTAGNALATLSIRGGTPEQSAVFWNGLSLQNTLNGNVDLNLLPSLAFDEISINASNSVHSGSGSTAGSLELNNGRYDTSNSVDIQTGMGSFGALNTALKITHLNKKNRFSVLPYYRQAVNNYPYASLRVPPGETRLSNAAFSITGLLYQHQIDLQKSNPLNIRLWTQTAYREIPATILEGQSRKSQIDRSIRLQSDWSKIMGQTEVKIVGGSFIESLNYRDSVAEIYTTYAFINNSLLVHVKRHLSKDLQIGLDAEARHFGADADTFYNQNRIEFSESFHIKYVRNKWLGRFGTRLVQYTTSTDKPILFSAQLERGLWKNWRVLALFSTNYRLPTFNNLFWNPGGNPNLTAEKSTNSELSIDYTTPRWKIKSNVYSNFIKDQIRWVPGTTGVFEAQQILNQIQWNRGLETTVQFAYKSWGLEGGFTRILSTVKNDSNQWQQSFVPLYQGNVGISYVKPKWRLYYGLQLVSKRFTDTENVAYLDAYLLHNAQFVWHYKAFDFKVIARNIGNLYYTVLPFRPNPTRNFQIDISYKLLKNKRK